MTEEVKPVAGGDAGLEAKDGAAKGRKPARNVWKVKRTAGVGVGLESKGRADKRGESL